MKICSLFAGVGGIDLAFLQAGFKTVWANEIDGSACNTYRINFPDVELNEGDIRTVNAKTIPDFDVLTAGFPCQPFSVCGKQKGFEDSRGNLFFEICRVIDAKKPKVIFLENVANLINHDNGNTFKVIYGELTKRGYLVKYAVMDACEYGIPQHRTRIYIVAFKSLKQSVKFKFPNKSVLDKHITDIIDQYFIADNELYFIPDTSKYNRLNEVIDDYCQLYRFSDYGIQKSDNGISFTLKANMGTWYDREPIIKDSFGIRKLSPKECFMLQGFPESFQVGDINKKEAYKQAGNTVCVPVVFQIAAEIQRAIS